MDNKNKNKENFIIKTKRYIKRFLSDLVREEYDLFRAFQFDSKARELLEKYFEELDSLKKNFTKEEYKDIVSSIKEHLYFAIRDQLKKSKSSSKKVSVKLVKKVIDELGRPDEIVDYHDSGKIVAKTAKKRGIGVWRICWIVIKYMILILLFISIYFPLLLTFFSLALTGVLAIPIWFINPTNFFGQPIVISSSLGWLTPIFFFATTLVGTGLFFLTLHLIVKFHWKRSLIRQKLFFISPIILGILVLCSVFVGFLVMNRRDVKETETKIVQLPQSRILKIGDIVGDIEVVGEEELEDKIETEAQKYATGYSQEHARNNLESLGFLVGQNEEEITVSTFHHQSAQEVYHFEKIDVKVRVPKDIQIVFDDSSEEKEVIQVFAFYDPSSSVHLKNIISDIDVEHDCGELKFENIQNSRFKLKNGHGSVALENVETEILVIEQGSGSTDLNDVTVGSEFKLESSHGSISASNITVPIWEVESDSGSISLRDINSDLTVTPSYGDLETDSMEGNLSIESGSGSISIKNLSGDADIESAFGSVDINSMKGDLKITSSSGSISVDRLSGSVDISSSFGDIDVDFDDVSEGSENFINSSSGSVNILIPDNCSPVVFVSSQSGSVDNDFMGNRGVESSPTFTIDVKFGWVSVRRK